MDDVPWADEKAVQWDLPKCYDEQSGHVVGSESGCQMFTVWLSPRWGEQKLEESDIKSIVFKMVDSRQKVGERSKVIVWKKGHGDIRAFDNFEKKIDQEYQEDVMVAVPCY